MSREEVGIDPRPIVVVVCLRVTLPYAGVDRTAKCEAVRSTVLDAAIEAARAAYPEAAVTRP